MKTIDLNAYQNELIRDILTTDNLEVLQAVRRAYHRAVSSVTKKTEVEAPAPYTIEELNSRIDEAEADFTAGRGVSTEVAHNRMKQFIAN